MKNFKQIILDILPVSLKKAVIHEFKVKEYCTNLGFHQISFSQQGEDIIIEKFFREQKIGFYVDIGAYHPVTYSNTFLLHKRGWRGINIDPNPETIRLFQLARKEDVNLQCAVASTSKEYVYNIFNMSAVNTIDDTHAAHWSSVEGFEIVTQQNIIAIPLKEILNNHLPLNMKIDFMNIDVEGFDLEVLKSNDWNKYRPTLIMVEEQLMKKTDFEKSEILQFMDQVQYKIYSICNGSVAFVDSISVIDKSH